MVYCYYRGTTPTTQGIKDIDDWLYKRYGTSQAINGYNGAVTSTTILETLAREYAGFPNSYKTTLTIDGVRQKISQGYPVIVAVNSGKLSNRGYSYAGGHFVVAKGYTSTHIIANDPGTINGNSKYYLNSEFQSAMSGGCVIVVPSPMITPSVKMVYPTGGEVWPMWSTKQIKWSYTGSPSSVKIELLKGTQVIKVASSAPVGSGGIGYYSIFVNQGTGQYRVRVTLNGICAATPSATSGVIYVT